MFRHLAIRCAAALVIGALSSLTGPTSRAEETVSRGPAETAEVTLGIASMSFSGDMERPDKGPVVYRFSSEPRIRRVDPEGPAAGILRGGDVIVAIDGWLITTKEGGLRFGDLVEGKPVTLTIRRWGSERDVVVVPRVAPRGRSTPASSPGVVRAPKATDEKKAARPAGWFGLALSCRGVTIETGNGHLEWRFEDLPRVRFVDPDGPAKQSGFLPGDLIVSLDGSRLDTEEGSRRFSAVEPGQELLWTVRRAGQEMKIRMVAGTGPRLKPGEQE